MKVATFDREDTPESDSRISAQAMGYVALIFVVMECTLFLIMDAHLIYEQIRYGVGHKNNSYTLWSGKRKSVHI